MYRKILVALDGTQSSKRALVEAIRMATLSHAHVRGLYVLDRAKWAADGPAATGPGTRLEWGACVMTEFHAPFQFCRTNLVLALRLLELGMQARREFEAWRLLVWEPVQEGLSNGEAGGPLREWMNALVSPGVR